MPGPRTAPAPKAPSPLIERLRAGGIVAPRTTVREARRAGLRLDLACAMLEKESSGGRNVYGHDPTIFKGRGKVTRANYAEYKRRRIASGNKAMQGVGPCQLTWWELQDTADAQGGCWRPEINMRVGFGQLAALVMRHGEAEGARRYNGSGAAAEAYSRDLMAKARRWKAIVEGPPARTRPAPRAEAPPAHRPHTNGNAPRAETPSPKLPTASHVDRLAEELRRRDADAERAWRSLAAYGHRRRRRLLAAEAAIEAGRGSRDAVGMEDLLASLGRIEGRLDTLVEVTVHEPELPARIGARAALDGRAAGTAPPVEEAPGRSVPELLREVEALVTRKRELQDELIARYRHADEQLAPILGEPVPVPVPEPAVPPRRGQRRRGGEAVTTKQGDSGRFVRRSKVALSRYLAEKGGPEHARVRRRLRREAATPRTGDVASAAWVTAVKAAQQLAGLPVTGRLDGRLSQLLLPYWPRDHIAKRAVRSTPAWRAIPGQLTPNFNIAELACKDQAHTPFVQGLMAEQGLSKRDARARSKGLATRLVRVRKLGGGRPLVITSAYRTKSYNASLTGSATNSAHTRGFAVDTPPPRGISLDQHKQHVMQAFECGVGYYPRGRGYFIHGDFDRTLGGRRLW